MLEIYSDLYYRTKFHAQVSKELEDGTAQAPETTKQYAARKMAIYQKHRSLAWASETEEVKATVQKIYDEEHKMGNQSDNEDDDAMDMGIVDGTEVQALELQQE